VLEQANRRPIMKRTFLVALIVAGSGLLLAGSVNAQLNTATVSENKNPLTNEDVLQKIGVLNPNELKILKEDVSTKQGEQYGQDQKQHLKNQEQQQGPGPVKHQEDQEKQHDQDQKQQLKHQEQQQGPGPVKHQEDQEKQYDQDHKKFHEDQRKQIIQDHKKYHDGPGKQHGQDHKKQPDGQGEQHSQGQKIQQKHLKHQGKQKEHLQPPGKQHGQGHKIQQKHLKHQGKQLTGKELPKENLPELVSGADEEDLVNSGLEETMHNAYREIRDIQEKHNKKFNLRTAAYIGAIDKIALSYEGSGIFP